ncbi:MAG: DUF5995 family protein, partial [Chloroflexota bacterium]
AKAYRDQKPLTAAWQIAFESAPRWRPIVLQHLLLGMNAHINLDLGIAAATVAPGAKLASLQDDFNKINAILETLVDDVKNELSEIWYPLALLNRLMDNTQDTIINFRMKRARDEAWQFAQALAPLNEKDQINLINDQDRKANIRGQLVAYPPIFTSLILFLIRIRERGKVPQIINILK